MIKEKETDEFDEDTEFTAPLITAYFGRYDNESPPYNYVFLKITKVFKQGKKLGENLKVF